MRRIWLLARNDLRLTLRDRPAFFWMLVLPVALMWLFGSVGFDNDDPRVRLTVVDHDGGWIARALVQELGGDEQIDVRERTPEEARADDDRVRTLVIPSGFTDAVLEGEGQTLRIEQDPDTSESFTLAAEAHVFRIAVRTLGRLVEMRVAGEDGGRDAAALFAELGRRDPLVTLDVRTAGAGRPVPSGRAQSVPGILTMTVLMMTLIYGAVFLTLEKRDGTLRRQMTLPLGRGHVVAGKLLGRFLIAALQTAMLLVVGWLLYGLTFGGSIVGLIVLATAYCLAVAALATLLGALVRTPEQASSLGWLAAMLLAALGGCWWPAEIMPRGLYAAAHVFPTTWAMDGFHALISFGRGLQGVLVPSAVLLAFAVVFSALGIRCLRVAGGGA